MQEDFQEEVMGGVFNCVEDGGGCERALHQIAPHCACCRSIGDACEITACVSVQIHKEGTMQGENRCSRTKRAVGGVNLFFSILACPFSVFSRLSCLRSIFPAFRVHPPSTNPLGREPASSLSARVTRVERGAAALSALMLKVERAQCVGSV